LKKSSFLANIKPTCLREREIQIIRENYGLIPLHRDMDAMDRNLRDKHMHPNEVKRTRHVSIVERLDMWKKYAIIVDMF